MEVKNYLISNKAKFIRISIIIIGIILLVIIFVYIFQFLTTGSLNVQTNNNNKITINSTEEDTNGMPIKGATSKLNTRLKGGSYYIRVTDGLNSVYKNINISNRKNYKETLNLQNPTISEEVISEESWSIAANKQELKFLSSLGILYSINSSNQQNILTGISFRTIKWASLNNGAAIDTGNNFYIINNNNYIKYALPDNINSGAYQINISKNGTIYLWTEKAIYKTTNGISINKIFSSSNDSKIDNVLPANDKLAVFTNKIAANKTTEKNEATGSEFDDTINLINLNGEVISKTNIEYYTASISNSGNLIAISSDEGTVILNNKMEIIVTLPNSNVNNLTWLNDAQLFYTVDYSIYKFDINKLESSTLTTAPLNSSINYLSLNDEVDTIYYVSTYEGQKKSINMVNLANKSVEKSTVEAGYILPKDFSDCYVKLINFTRPTIQMTVTTADYVPFCKIKTTEYLNDDGIDSKKFTYTAKEVLDD